MADDVKPTNETLGRDTGERGSKFAQDLPGASRGPRSRWKKLINGGSPEEAPPNSPDNSDATPKTHRGDAGR